MSIKFSYLRGYHFIRIADDRVAVFMPTTCAHCNKELASVKTTILCKDDRELIWAGVKPGQVRLEVARTLPNGVRVCTTCLEAWKDPIVFYRKNPLIVELP